MAKRGSPSNAEVTQNAIGKTGTKTRMMVSPVNGAQTPVGSKPGYGGKPGRSGRKRDEFRQKLTEIVGKRTGFVADVVDGKVMQRAEFPLLMVARHVRCAENEDHEIVPLNPETAGLVTIVGEVSASVKDRISALDFGAKYGVGTLKEVSVEDVRGRVRQTLDVIRGALPADQADAIIASIRPLWV